MSFRRVAILVVYLIIIVSIGLLVLKQYGFNVEIIKEDSVSILSEVKQVIDTVVTDVRDNKNEANTETIKVTESGIKSHNYFVADGYKNKFRVMLQNGEYQKLNRSLEKLQNDVNINIVNEGRLFVAYSSFEIKNADYEALFNYWVIATPDNYQPYLARASYYYAMSWLSRGHKFMARTSDKAVDEMYDYFKLAMNDISVVISKNNKIVVPHYLLIGMSAMGNGNRELTKVMSQALAINPLSYELRVRYLNFITPRWGGSLKMMSSFIEQTEKHMPKNIRLEALSGLALSEAGEMQALKKNYKKAEEYFTTALSLGENHDTLYERGITRSYLKKYKAAIKDLSRAIEIYSQKSRYYYWRARSYNALKKYDKAASDIKKAYSLDPFDTYVKSHINWMTNRLVNEAYKLNSDQKFEQAINKYSLALDLSPNGAANYDYRSRSYIGLHKMGKALDDIKTAIRLDPSEIRYYLMVDYLLAKSEKWDEIIRYWDKFIKLKPGNGRAYMERGGSHFRKGDLQAAIKNAKKSSELGYLEGKEMYKRLKLRIK